MQSEQPKRAVTEKLKHLLELLDEPPGAEPADPHARTGVATSRFSLIGLDEVRETLGPRWSALSDQVHRLAASVISSHLAKGDVFELQDATTYVVLFATLSQVEADFKSRIIAKEITRRLLGSEWQPLATVEATFTDVPKAALYMEDLDAALNQAFDRGQRVVTSELEGPERGLIQERECLPLRGWEEQVWEGKRPRFSLPPDAGLAPAAGSPASSAEAELEAQISADRARGLAWRYLPIWDFRQRAMIHFRILPAGEQARQLRRAQAKGGMLGEQAVFECDLRSLKRMLADLEQLAANQRRLPVITTVHVASIAPEARRYEILRLLRDQPPEIRRLVHLTLTSPPDLPETRSIAEFIRAVQALKAGVSLTVPLTRSRALNSLERTVGCIAADLSTAPKAEAIRMKLLDRFAGHAIKAGVDCHAMGLGSRSLVVAAAAAGFRYLSGEAIHPAMEVLGHASRLDLDELYERLSPTELFAGARRG